MGFEIAVTVLIFEKGPDGAGWLRWHPCSYHETPREIDALFRLLNIAQEPKGRELDKVPIPFYLRVLKRVVRLFQAETDSDRYRYLQCVSKSQCAYGDSIELMSGLWHRCNGYC